MVVAQKSLSATERASQSLYRTLSRQLYRLPPNCQREISWPLVYIFLPKGTDWDKSALVHFLRLQIALALRAHAICYTFEKFIRAYLSQIAFEIM